MRLAHHASWEANSPSKLTTGQTCWRKYFFKYRLGWRSTADNVNITHGSAVHSGMEELFKAYGKSGKYEDGLEAADIAYLKTYTEVFSDPELWEVNSPKNPNGASVAFELYATEYEDDQFELIGMEGIEESMVIPVSPTQTINGKLDNLVRTDEGIVIVDHKTSKNSLNQITIDGWNVNLQFGSYNLMGLNIVRLLDLNPDDFLGVMVNYMVFQETKRDGLNIELPRFIVKKNIIQQQQFMHEISTMLDWIKWNNDLLLNEIKSEDPDIAMLSFPRNFDSCTKFYRRCSFYDICRFHVNPAIRFAGQPLTGFKVYDRYREVTPDLVADPVTELDLEVVE